MRQEEINVHTYACSTHGHNVLAPQCAAFVSVCSCAVSLTAMHMELVLEQAQRVPREKQQNSKAKSAVSSISHLPAAGVLSPWSYLGRNSNSSRQDRSSSQAARTQPCVYALWAPMRFMTTETAQTPDDIPGAFGCL